jgi:hypothetical protein
MEISQNIITTKIYRKPNYMISTNIIIDCFIVEPYCIIIIMLSEPNIICINNLLNLEKDISVSV